MTAVNNHALLLICTVVFSMAMHPDMFTFLSSKIDQEKFPWLHADNLINSYRIT